MKKYIVGLGLSALMLGSFTNVQAVTLAELQAQINALMAQLQAIQNQSSTGGYTTGGTTAGGSMSDAPVSSSVCYTFTQNLKVDDGLSAQTEPMVRALQVFLDKEGFVIFDNEKRGGVLSLASPRLLR